MVVALFGVHGGGELRLELPASRRRPVSASRLATKEQGKISQDLE
jgi:hypothetical protein